MKKHIFLKLFLLVMLQSASFQIFSQDDFRKKSPAPGPAPVIQLGEAKEMTLKNGLKVIMVENHKLPQVSFQLFVDVPPILEKDNAGYISLAGQMLSRGTTTKTKAEIDEAVDFLGASLSTSATGMFGSCLSKHTDKLVEIMADVLLNPTFPEEEFEKLKKQSLSALAQSKDDPNSIAANVSSVMRYGKNHPYGEIETEESITSITVDHCKGYYDRWFKPNISYLIVVGDFDFKQIDKLVNGLFGEWQMSETKGNNRHVFEETKETTVDFVDKTGAVQSVINITYPILLPPGHEQVINASVMNTMLGGFFSSRLNSNLREDKGFTYGARSTLSPDLHVGSFTAYASVRNEVTDSSIVEFISEMNRLRNELIDEEELNLVKNVMSGSFARQLESPQTIASFNLNIARYKMDKDYYKTYLQRLSDVSAQDIQNMARRFLRPEQAHIVVVGNKDEVADKLGQFAKSGKVDFYNSFGEPLTEDGMQVPPGVTANSVIADYITAIGGKDNLGKVNSIKIKTSGELQTGMVLEMTVYQMSPNKSRTEMGMAGNIVTQVIFDGENGKMTQMGAEIPFPEEMKQELKEAGSMFPELNYSNEGFAMELNGIESVEGKNAFKVKVTYPSGKKVTQYYDMETSLKIREVSSAGGATETKDFSDYKEVEGVKYPHVMVTAGAGLPVPLKLAITELTVNKDVEESLFSIN